jgi:hypothetical protein
MGDDVRREARDAVEDHHGGTRRLDFFVAAAIATTVTIIAYHRGLGFSFALDDYTFLFRAAGIDPDPFTLRRILGTRLYYKLGYELFGVSSTLPWHLCSFALHVGNALWVYVLARHFRVARDAAWLACGLFAASPLAFTVMYWIAGTQELASGFFLLASIWVSLRNSRRRWWAVPLYAAAVLCKESVLAAPVVLPLLGGRRMLRLAATQLGVGAALFVGSGLHLRALDTDPTSPYATDYGLGLLRNLASSLVWLASPWRRYPDRIAEADPALMSWAAGMFMIGSVLLGFAGRRLARPTLVALAWFVCLLLPALPLRQHFYAYYLYLPSIGVVILFSTLALGLVQRLANAPKRGASEARLGVALFLLTLCVVFARRNAHTHETLMLSNALAHHDSVIRYGTASAMLRSQIRAANLPSDVRRVALVMLETAGPGALTPGSRTPVAGSVRVRKVPVEITLYGGKFFKLHFPDLEGNLVRTLTPADEGGDTAFFLCHRLASLKPLPDAAAAYAILALGSFIGNDYAAAEAPARRALELRANEPTARLVMAGVLAAQGNVRDAERILTTLQAQGLEERMRPFMQKVRDLMKADEDSL